MPIPPTPHPPQPGFHLALISSRAIMQPCFRQHVDEEEDLIQQAITDITQLCAENVILWAQFLEAVTLRQEVHQLLAKEHHNMRVSPPPPLGQSSAPLGQSAPLGPVCPPWASPPPPFCSSYSQLKEKPEWLSEKFIFCFNWSQMFYYVSYLCYVELSNCPFWGETVSVWMLPGTSDCK